MTQFWSDVNFDVSLYFLNLHFVRHQRHSLFPNSPFSLQARAGVAPTVEYLRLARAFVNEENYTVWSDLSANLGSVDRLLQGLDCHCDYQTFIRQLFTPIGTKLGWEAKEGESEYWSGYRPSTFTRMNNVVVLGFIMIPFAPAHLT